MGLFKSGKMDGKVEVPLEVEDVYETAVYYFYCH